MDLTKISNYQYHIKNNTPTGQVLKALNDYFETTNRQIDELKRKSIAQIQQMSNEVRAKLDILEEDLKKCDEAHNRIKESLSRLNEY